MIGRRRPNRVFRRSDQAPTIGGTVIASRPPRPSATPTAVFCVPFGTTPSIWVWISTVVSGIHRKLLPNQKRSEEHTSELQSHLNLVCRLLLEKKKKHSDIHILTQHTEH